MHLRNNTMCYLKTASVSTHLNVMKLAKQARQRERLS